MSFSEELNGLMDHPSSLVRRFMALLEPVDDARLEAMAQESRRLTRLHFGRTIRLFAPIYLSNECINNCKYCGFSRDNPIIRTTLTVDEVVQEARYLHGLGLRSILLVAGEHPKFVSDGYMQECLDALHSFIPAGAGNRTASGRPLCGNRPPWGGTTGRVPGDLQPGGV